MNYKKIHDNIIKKAIERGWSKKSAPVFTEKHHILPKSMGGDNSKENLVCLTPREHYIIHKLLYKIHKTKEMAWAWISLTRMTRTGAIRCSSREFDKARILAGELSSERMLTDNPSQNMIGKLSPNWTGYWATPEGLFENVYLAADANGVGKSSVQRRCKNPDVVITADRLGLENYGKTWRELGWYFIPKEEFNECV